MKRRVADYIADCLADHGIKNVFTVVGGGAMHLNDAFGNHDRLSCIYNHHEQASAIAAEGYARAGDRIAAVCVTTGPGGTNALTGVLGAYQDNIPVLVISGQVRYSTTVDSTGLALRQFGEQEYDIAPCVRHMTKYAEMIRTPTEIRYHLEKALFIAQNGRRGPVWLDVPLDVQGATVETDNLVGFVAPQADSLYEPDAAEKIMGKLKTAKRPLILAGSGIRSANALAGFRQLIGRLNIPVVAATSISDLLPIGHPLYFGNFGVFGGRAGNFMVQNADVILTLGCRLSFKQVGFNFHAFAPQAYKIVVDIDDQELKKNTVKIDFPVHQDIQYIINSMLMKAETFENRNRTWLAYGEKLRGLFPVFQDKYKISDAVNPYYFAEILQEILAEDAIVVVGNSCASVSVLQCGVRKAGQRLFGNVNCGSMGYDMPAAIGACVAAGRKVICVTGDGSIQMNLQELQTVVHNRLPVKIIVFNNGGYQAIVQTQINFFAGRLSGCNKQSGMSLPDFQRLSYAYDMPYMRISRHVGLKEKLAAFLEQDGYGICEIIQDRTQPIEPKMQSKKLPDGSIVSPALDDLAPFLDRDMYKKVRYCEEE